MAIRSKLGAIIRLKCPACHQGNLFKSPNPYNLSAKGQMHKECPVCGQDFVIEPGFYFGSAYISYAINVAIMVGIMLVSFLVYDLSILQLLLIFLPVFLILTPLIFRISRSIWIHIFVSRKYWNY